MKKTLGVFYRVSALFVVCAMLASCTPSLMQLSQENVSQWQAAGSPVAVSCRYPFEIATPRSPGGMGSQAHTSMRDFLPAAAAAAYAPIRECAVIGGSDTEPDAAQIAGAGWGSLGYVPLHVWRPATAFIVLGFSYTWRLADPPPPGPQDSSYYQNYYLNPSYSDISEIGRYSEKITAPYGAWYLAYQRIPQDDEPARRQGAGLYAMQGFRCAIQMRDFAAARRYWALALSSNPESTAAYGQIALQSFFQVLFRNFRSNQNDSDGAPDYLGIPQDIRSAVWTATGQRYSAEGGGSLSMAQVEEAAQAGELNPIISKKIPVLSLLYCPVFYPDFYPNFDSTSIIDSFYLDLHIPFNELRYAIQRAQAGTAVKTGTAGKDK